MLNRHHLRPGVDAGIVNHRVHAAEAVHVAGNAVRLLEVGDVADDGRSAAIHEVADGGEPVADVDDDLVPVVE
jgi:hypothetical protein